MQIQNLTSDRYDAIIKNTMSELAIIGGGISGLCAGIYAQLSGLQSEIFEGHSVVGGQCTSWTRKG
ncbi:MAG: NAD(P)/FAD-dependent oxidoreductase, partial [Bacteroidales bacterium]|nr:NAD(P)/FAD-dependent oxidoreductase [Bacteroidales bacterium]